MTYLASVDEKNKPYIKALYTNKHDGIFVHYFATILSAKRTAQLKSNPEAAIYFCSDDMKKGVMLQGKIEVLTDRNHKEMLWRDGFERYYPQGVDSEDYCAYRFEAYKGNLYYDLVNYDFTPDDMKGEI